MATIYHVTSYGPAGCLLGVCVWFLAIAALAFFAVLGIVTLTVAVWIAAGFVLLALIAVLAGRIAGRPGQEDR